MTINICVQDEQVNVDVAVGEINTGKPPVLQEISITKDGTYTPDYGVDGFSKVDVFVLPTDMLDGLEDGWDVMFYDEYKRGLASYSIKKGHAINPPVYTCKNWQNADKEVITFPYKPTEDVIFYALNLTYADLLYEHFGVDKGVYPYVMVQVIHKTTNSSYPYTYKIAFFDTITKSINQPRLVGVNSNISQSTHDYYISDLANVEEVVNAIKERVTTINSSYSADIVDENSTTLFYTHYTNFDYSFNYSTHYRLDE